MKYLNVFILTALFSMPYDLLSEGNFLDWRIAISLCVFFDAFNGWKYSE